MKARRRSQRRETDGEAGATQRRKVERIQTGLRMERRLVKVLKGLAEYHDITLGDLVEGIVLHAFDGKLPFSQKSLDVIEQLRAVYALDLRAEDSHRLAESETVD